MPTPDERAVPLPDNMVRMPLPDLPRQFIRPAYPASPNTILRCPLPPSANTPDSLRQFYQDGLIPQGRILSPSTLSGGGGGSTGAGSLVITNTTKTIAPKTVAATTVVTTTALDPNTSYLTPIAIAKSFLLLLANASAACRVELYANATSQSGDIARPISMAPGMGTEQGLISDIVLDSSPFAWFYVNTLGFSGDDPQTTNSYITVTNIGSMTTAITVTLTYVPLSS